MQNSVRSLVVALFHLTWFGALAQSYTSYIVGSTDDVNPQPSFGIVLMGGAGEDDEAMKWFLQCANGGDVLVIRASGSDGYNNYMYSQLGVSINSVETIVFHNAMAASDPYVIQQVQNAEAIWMAGGNQATYVNYWKNNAIEQAINDLLLVKGGAVGGLSAGMAILGGSYFSALNGSVTSAEALANPYNEFVTLGHGDFLAGPFLNNVITDTHFDNPDRRGRLSSFMARMFTDHGFLPLAIACDEYAAVCIGEDGVARCFGESPQYDDNVYFVRPNCPEPIGPETCTVGEPLTWHRAGEAIKVYRIKATSDGSRTFDLNDWLTGVGGEWLNWSVQNGTFSESVGATAPTCAVTAISENEKYSETVVYPNPTSGIIRFNADMNGKTVSVFAPDGRLIMRNADPSLSVIDLSTYPAGLYLVHFGHETVKILLE